jgi:serine/threonine-protein kinase ULK/ATG1
MADRTYSASSKRTKPASDDVIGNFIIDKEIGKGSFAQVYSGRHKVSFLGWVFVDALWV